MYFTRLQVVCDPEFTEILIAEIAEAGFDMFMETEHGFEADAAEASVDKELLDQIREKYQHVKPLIFSQDRVLKKNWNKEWEKNVDPIVVEDQCLVRAEFHRISKKYPYEIIITPKMSFGTGHHQTTHLMLKQQLVLDHKDKLVMDAGCGTAILSVMASLRGAKFVEAFDIDSWSVENGSENAQLNGCTNIRIRQGTLAELDWQERFDIILANINKNVILAEFGAFGQHLLPGGSLVLSGILADDMEEVLSAGRQQGFRELSRDQRDNWALLLLERKS